MTRFLFLIMLVIVMLLTPACGLMQSPAPQPQLSATETVPQATAMSELPPTWTPIPTQIPSPTLEPSPTPLPTQDPSAYQIGLVMNPDQVNYPTQTADRTGWKLVEGKTAKILIPSNFEELDFADVFMELLFGVMEAFAEGFVEFAEDLGEELGATPQATAENFDLGELTDMDFVLAFEESSQSAIIFTSAERFPDTTTEDLLNEALTDSETDFQVINREIYIDSPFPTERVILAVEDPELGTGIQVIYVILGDQKAWNLVFTTPENLFTEYLLIFESVVDSLTPLS